MPVTDLKRSPKFLDFYELILYIWFELRSVMNEDTILNQSVERQGIVEDP
jgi:hypothetical protein